jgi:putative addiction module component (TIGR02574 family)
MRTDPVDIRKLTHEQRLQLLEALWESLSQDPDRIPLTAAQREELDRRLDELELDGAGGIPWDEVLAQIRDRKR